MGKYHDRHRHGRPDKGNKHESSLLNNEGEGSKTAARNYNAELRSFIDEKRVEPAAKEAKQFVEEHPDEAGAAEDRAKHGPRPILKRVGELVAEGRAMFSRTSERVRGMIRRRIRRHA